MKNFFSVVLIFISLPIFAFRAADDAFWTVEKESMTSIKHAIQKNSSFYAYTRGSDKENLLMAALKADRDAGVIRLLLDAGVSASAHTRSKKTALMYACQYSSDIKAIKTVLSYGAPLPIQKKLRILKKDKDGKTCFDYAKKNEKSDEILALLLKYAQEPLPQVSENPQENSAINEEAFVAENEVQKDNTSVENPHAEIEDSFVNEIQAKKDEPVANDNASLQKEETIINQENLPEPKEDSVLAKKQQSPSIPKEVTVLSVETKTPKKAVEIALPADEVPVTEKTVSKIVEQKSDAINAQPAPVAVVKVPEPPKNKVSKTEVSQESIYLYDYAPKDSLQNAIPDSLVNMRSISHKFIPDSNSSDDNGRTPLMLAAKNGDIELIENLLYSGAQIESRDSDGWTALMYAVRFQGNLDVVKTLLLYGASYKTKNAYGFSPLLLATGFSSNPEIVSLLLDYYAPTSEEARYAFIYAVSNSVSPSVLNVFFNKGVPVNVPYDGKTALMYAAESCSDTKTISWLLSKGASIYQVDSVTGKCAFDFARENSSLKHDKVYWSLDPNQ